jgi:hypothetical protein
MTTTSPHPLPAQTHLLNLNLNLILFLLFQQQEYYSASLRRTLVLQYPEQRISLRTLLLCVKKQNADNADGADEHR